MEKLGVYADVADLLELMFLVELMVVSVNGAAKGESRLVVGVGKSVEVDLEWIEDAKEVERVLACDTKLCEGITEDRSVRFSHR